MTEKYKALVTQEEAINALIRDSKRRAGSLEPTRIRPNLNFFKRTVCNLVKGNNRNECQEIVEHPSRSIDDTLRNGSNKIIKSHKPRKLLKEKDLSASLRKSETLFSSTRYADAIDNLVYQKSSIKHCSFNEMPADNMKTSTTKSKLLKAKGYHVLSENFRKSETQFSTVKNNILNRKEISNGEKITTLCKKRKFHRKKLYDDLCKNFRKGETLFSSSESSISVNDNLFASDTSNSVIIIDSDNDTPENKCNLTFSDINSEPDLALTNDVRPNLTFSDISSEPDSALINSEIDGRVNLTFSDVSSEPLSTIIRCENDSKPHSPEVVQVISSKKESDLVIVIASDSDNKEKAINEKKRKKKKTKRHKISKKCKKKKKRKEKCS